MISTTHVKVRGYHLDVHLHVNNIRYLQMLEEARWDYLEQTGYFDYCQVKGLSWVLTNININFRQEVRLGQEITISSYFKKIGSRNAVLHQSMKVEGIVVCDADVTVVCIDRSTGKAAVFEGELGEHFRKALVKPSS